MNKRNLFLNAPNVNHGGGKILLFKLIDELKKIDDINIIANLDERISIPKDCYLKIRIRKIKKTIFSRLLNEIWLFFKVRENDIIFCFGNLPPLLKSSGKTITFLQNRYLVDSHEMSGLYLKVKVRLFAERLWFNITYSRVNKFLVQNSTMKNILVEKKGIDSSLVNIIPFINDDLVIQKSNKIKKIYEFCYIASGEAHKNHINLVRAWILLAKEGYFPSLCITVDENDYPKLVEYIKYQKIKWNLKLINLGNIQETKIKEIYKKTKALIYPSKFESFGLPLIEAKKSNIPILASELDYVRDLIDPAVSFDPYSSVSISRAVKRFKNLPEKKQKIYNAKDIVDLLIF